MIALEPVRLAHAEALQVLFEDPPVVEHLTFPSPYPPGEMAKYIADAMAERARGRKYVFAIIEPDGRPSGIALLKGVDVTAGVGELGYALGRPYWGGGRATAAASAVIEFAFDILHLQSLIAICGELNVASLRVLHKLGFVEESRAADSQPRWPEPRVQIRLRLSREEWRKSETSD
ncbi:MAG TPA: GNAT family N-acetyltransferase [Vicinamibacterales bacterium]|nr:GNAT family N-acetyltransferase [Vicinamibacterales bacterium]